MIEFLPETYKVEIILYEGPSAEVCIRMRPLQPFKWDFRLPSTAPSGQLREGIGQRSQLSRVPRKSL